MFNDRPVAALRRVASFVALAAALALPSAWAAAPAPTAPAAAKQPAPAAVAPAPVPTTIDLTGAWKFATDRAENGQDQGWQKPDFDSNSWRNINVPGPWEEQGITYANPKWPNTSEDNSDGYNGYAWYRRSVVIPAGWTQGKVTLHVGAIDDADWTYVNGVQVGSTPVSDQSYNTPRSYDMPAGVLRPGKPNVIAIRVLDKGGQGGITQSPVELTYGAGTAAAPATSAPPPAPGTYARTSGSITKAGADVEVPADMKVTGDVTAVGGSVHVDGYVTGNVSAVGGSVYLNPTARVDGNASAMGGHVERAAGAVLGGSITEAPGVPGANLNPEQYIPHQGGPGDEWPNLLVWIFIAVLATLLFPRRIQVMARALPADPGRAAVTGLIGWFATPFVLLAASLITAAVIVVLAVTLVGIIAIPFVALALAAFCVLIVAFAFLGLAAVWTSLGQAILDRSGHRHVSPVWASIVGVLVLWLVTFVLDVLHLAPLGVLIILTLFLFGFGLVLMTGAGEHEGWSFREWRPLHRRRRGEPAAETPEGAASESGEPAASITAPTPVEGETEPGIAGPPPTETGEAPPAPETP